MGGVVAVGSGVGVAVASTVGVGVAVTTTVAVVHAPTARTRAASAATLTNLNVPSEPGGSVAEKGSGASSSRLCGEAWGKGHATGSLLQ